MTRKEAPVPHPPAPFPAAWPLLVLLLLGLLAVVAGATGGEYAETLANGSSL
jgi:hypothetical protein